MKRGVVALLAMLCLVGTGAQAAQSYTLGDVEQGNYYTCTDFDAEMPSDVAEIFSSLLREGDEVVCGSRGQARNSRLEGLRWDTILMAIRREGNVLLLGAYKRDGEWETCVETDSFLSSDMSFEITYLPAEDGEEWGIEPNHAILCGDEIWRIHIQPGGRMELAEHERVMEDGTRVITETMACTLRMFMLKEGVFSDQGHWHCALSSWLSEWSMKAFPRGIEQIQQYVQAHQPMLGKNQAYICGVNLREEPTRQSGSLGVYSARVDVLESKPGAQAPWYHVRVGGTEGWVSANYLLDGSEYDVRYYAMGAATVSPARADQEVELRRSPNGETFARLLPGATMHVIAEKDGWLHVVVPENGVITAKVDWDGVYGYVRAGEVVQGATLTDLKWK